MRQPPPFRIGQGVDVHRFTSGDHVMLCGVKIPHTQALLAHSDGDVALHALCDALLGAMALGDIGRHFPDNDPAWRGVDSRVLLRHVVGLMHKQGYAIANLDVTILAERPRITPWVLAMQQVLAEDLLIAVDQISVKATTTEKLGFVGREEGITALASVLLCVG